eukprot:181322-Prymnesium_polylepis.1
MAPGHCGAGPLSSGSEAQHGSRLSCKFSAVRCLRLRQRHPLRPRHWRARPSSFLPGMPAPAGGPRGVPLLALAASARAQGPSRGQGQGQGAQPQVPGPGRGRRASH